MNWHEAVTTMAATDGLRDREREQAARQIALLLGAFDDLATTEWLMSRHWTGRETAAQTRAEMYRALVG